MLEDLFEQARDEFVRGFGRSPAQFGYAPGRVELLGNHTDHNGGLVLAAAIDRFTVVAGAPSREPAVTIRSTFSDDVESFGLNAIEPGEPGSWGRYVKGVLLALHADRDWPLTGFDAAIAGDVPIGAGLSSSASLQAAMALCLLQLQSSDAVRRLDDAERMALAKLLRRAENDFVGVASGLLDQFSVLFGRADCALMLDCRTEEYERLPLGAPAPAIIVCDSKTSRRLADGMYNCRRAECETVVAYFQTRKGDEAVKQLRDVTLEALEDAWNSLDVVGRRRARHVLTENDRVRQGAQALRAGNSAMLGRLISQSHASSRDDFENSSPALDALIDAAERSPGFLGGKLSGAGWAGCTVNLVDADKASEFADSVRVGYAGRTGIEPAVYVCRAADGAGAGAL
jgi:galactokinase